MALAVCRAVKVLCVAGDDGALASLRRATVAAEWELTPGATTETDALGLVDAERPHALVAFGGFERLVALVRDRFPAMRIVTDRAAPGASVVVASPDEVREALRALARPGGPVRSIGDG
ncbi:MAG TPA: hypothetical protein VFQ40_06480 [Actinomycetota bacterium]|nr:hypothetical protein [Actinomycetota bacterium]